MQRRQGYCVGCLCVKEGHVCVSCHPAEAGQCSNNSDRSVSASARPAISGSNTITCSPQCAPQIMDPASTTISPDTLNDPLASSPTLSVSFPGYPVPPPPNSPTSDGYYLGQAEYDRFILEAYGAPICYSCPSSHDSERVKRWRSVTQLPRRHYDLPRGVFGITRSLIIYIILLRMHTHSCIVVGIVEEKREILSLEGSGWASQKDGKTHISGAKGETITNIWSTEPD